MNDPTEREATKAKLAEFLQKVPANLSLIDKLALDESWRKLAFAFYDALTKEVERLLAEAEKT